MKDLKLALIQADTRWEERETNYRHLEDLIRKVPGDTGLIILPEMFSTGFTMEPEKCFQDQFLSEISWLKRMAKQTGSTITGSFIARENKNFYNRLAFVTPDGISGTYDKRHLFRMGGEDIPYSRGKEVVDIHYRHWIIKPLICYDLRFPVWIRSGEKPDLLIFVANWPAARNDVWLTLLKARAIENQCYVAGVNRTGTDGRGIYYSGNSVIYNPRGILMATAPEEQETVIPATLDYEDMVQFRKKFPVHLDADRFQILP